MVFQAKISSKIYISSQKILFFMLSSMSTCDLSQRSDCAMEKYMYLPLLLRSPQRVD